MIETDIISGNIMFWKEEGSLGAAQDILFGYLSNCMKLFGHLASLYPIRYHLKLLKYTIIIPN